MQTYELATRLFCGVVVVRNFMSTVGSLFRISASCILMVDRRGLVCVMVPHRSAPSWEALQNSLALHEIGCILNLEYERSELLLSNHSSTQRLVLHFKIGWKIV
jgi:hypothetical protein